MPSITITPAQGNIITFSVTDKADAIRKISVRLLREFDENYVETSLNAWLATGMDKGVTLGHADERFNIRYSD